MKKGQALARLDGQDARLSAAAASAQVAVTDADLAFAKAELDRTRQLLDQKFISQAAGIITAVLAEAGRVVTAGQPIVKLARTEEREV